jgi:uncharacterized protein DUF3151
MEHGNLLGGPPPTYLPEDPAADELEYGVSPTDVAAAHPACLAAWAALSDEAIDRGENVASYAYARTGYHRGLDQLRRAGLAAPPPRSAKTTRRSGARPSCATRAPKAPPS